MSLLLPPWYFAWCSDNQPSTPGLKPDYGVTVTSGISNADGSVVEILPALAHDVHRLVINVAGTGLSATDTSTLLDIMRDPAGGSSWADFIDDLACGYLPNNTDVNNAGLSAAAYFDFPIYIRAGTSLGGRARTSHTVARAIRVSVWAFGEPSRPDMWWCGQGVESLGASPSTSKGTTVSPGASGSWGSWTSIGSPTSHRYGSLLLALNGSDSSSLDRSYYFQPGYSSVMVPGWPTNIIVGGAAEQFAYLRPNGPFLCDIPASTQMQVRGMGNNTAENWNLMLYGVY